MGWHIAHLVHRCNYRDRQSRMPCRRHNLSGAAQGAYIAHHKAVAQQFRLISVDLGNDFRANAGSVAHGDGQRFWRNVYRVHDVQ